MKIDSAVKTFFEKYDREAIQSIDNISREHGLVIHESTIKSFNLKESFDIFGQYLKGYATYKSESVNNEEATSQDMIKESVESFINTQIFKETATKYADLPTFVTGYIEGINSLNEAIDEAKRIMNDANVKPEDIGDINEFTDMFMDKLHEHFYPVMESILWASGYNAKKILYNPNSDKPAAPVFL